MTNANHDQPKNESIQQDSNSCQNDQGIIEMINPGHSHSFDISIAKVVGVNAAIVFNHIIYWLRINAAKNKNFIENKTWMYETQKEIAACLDYLTLDEVKKSLYKLIKCGLIIKGNFNKNPFDQTAWYTVYNQQLFQKNFTKEPCGTIKDSAVRHNAECQDAPCIYNEQEEHFNNKKEKEPEGFAAEAAILSLFFLNKLLEKKPNFKKPKDMKRWDADFDKMIRIDKRDPEHLKKLIEWVNAHQFWHTVIFSPAKLRKQLDSLEIQMQGDSTKNIVRRNRELAIAMKEQYPKQLKSLTFDEKYVMNRSIGKEVPLSLPTESFKKAILSLFGGRDV